MVIDDRKAHDDLADAAFGRMLLESAKTDGVSSEAVQRAWSSFARATGSVASVSVVGHGVWSRILRGTSARWIVLGALGGGSISAVWTAGHLSATATSVAGVATPEPPPPVQARSDEALGLSAAPVPSTLPSDWTPKVTAGVRHRHAIASPSRPAPTMDPTRADDAPEPVPHPRPARASTLPAEVIALDAARASLAAREFERALRIVDDYHARFRGGQLAADAEVIAIEALEAKGVHAEAARRGSVFLEEHPNDPHAARIGSICAR